MEIQGKWTKDEEGYIDFETSQLQRYYEVVTDQYYHVYNRYAEEFDDEVAHHKARADGYEMVTDYKTIHGKEEFATCYITPSYIMDIWYETDKHTQKRNYKKGFVRISSK